MNSVSSWLLFDFDETLNEVLFVVCVCCFQFVVLVTGFLVAGTLCSSNKKKAVCFSVFIFIKKSLINSKKISLYYLLLLFIAIFTQDRADRQGLECHHRHHP